MIAVVYTQIFENYGAHDWDRVGECPQYWKAKGGSEYKITDLPPDADLKLISELAELAFVEDSDFYREYVIDVAFRPNDYMSEFEKSQLEYDGHIAYPEKIVKYSDIFTDFHAKVVGQEFLDEDVF